MKQQTNELLAQLKQYTSRHIAFAEKLIEKSPEELNMKPSPESWSVLECIEHLNRYGNFYLEEIEQRIKNSKYGPAAYFKSGWLGNYFANSMLPKEKLNKMKTFKNMDTSNIILGKPVIGEFIRQQQKMLDLLEMSAGTDLSRVKTSITISKLIKLRLGDTLRFVVYHNERHVVQAQKVLNYHLVNS